MLQYLKQNKHVIMVAVALFVVSMSTILFFIGSNGGLNGGEIKTDVLDPPAVTESIDVKSMQEKETAYRKLVNDQEDPVFVMNVDGTIRFASWDVENALGYKQTEINKQIFFLLIHPDDLSTFLGAFGKVIQNKKPETMVGPYRLRDNKGEYHLNMGSLYPIMNGDSVEEIAISSRDITKKVQDNQSNTEDKKPAPAPAPKKKIAPQTPKAGRFLADENGRSHGKNMGMIRSNGVSTGVDFGSGGKVKESKNPDGGGKNVNDCAKV